MSPKMQRSVWTIALTGLIASAGVLAAQAPPAHWRSCRWSDVANIPDLRGQVH